MAYFDFWLFLKNDTPDCHNFLYKVDSQYGNVETISSYQGKIKTGQILAIFEFPPSLPLLLASHLARVLTCLIRTLGELCCRAGGSFKGNYVRDLTGPSRTLGELSPQGQRTMLFSRRVIALLFGPSPYRANSQIGRIVLQGWRVLYAEFHPRPYGATNFDKVL